MTNEEYQRTQQVLILVGNMVEELDLCEFHNRISIAETLGPMLDPTMYREAMGNIQKIDNLATAVRSVQKAFAELKEEVGA